MTADTDISPKLQRAVTAAIADHTPLNLTGAGTKMFFGREPTGSPLSLGGHRGIVNYEPKELVLTARAGTPLAEVKAALAGQQQMLPFEPPHFGEGATLGGTIACGLSGPRRPYTGSARDFVLGIRMINGRGEIVRFGGEVMKNVAGYDLSRLMTGALGTLGVILEISLKILPAPEQEITLLQEQSPEQAIRQMNRWAGTPLPLSAACYDGLQLHLRLSGTAKGIRAGQKQIGGDLLADGDNFWRGIREQRHAFFQTGQPLWRLSVAPAADPLALPGKQLIDWGGAQRWLITDADSEGIFAAARQAGGHGTLFRGGDRSGGIFQPLSTASMALHRRLKQAFDPDRIFNPGRLYPNL